MSDVLTSDIAPTTHARSAAEAQAAILDAAAAKAALRIVGAHSWHGSGPPRQAARVLSLRELTGIVAYVPGDLTITALAGTSLSELSHATAAHGQWLGLDPAGSRHGTIGATVATASSGPLAHAFGTPRDLVLGLDAVTGYGDIVRPGGRVVKNVAGFDLVRLFTGSWGTLGPITSVTLRLRALPVQDVTLAIPVDDQRQLPVLLQALRQPTLSLLACEWLDGTTSQSLGVSDGRDVVLVRFGGNDSFTRGQRAVLNLIAECHDCDPAVWGKLSLLDAGAAAVVRVSGSVSSVSARIARLRQLIGTPAVQLAMHATLTRGIVRIMLTGDVEAARQSLQVEVGGEQRIAERLPNGWWSAEPDPFASGLAARIRRAFDPLAICNPRVDAHA